MSSANKELVTQFIQALGKGDSTALRALVTDDFTATSMGTGALAGTYPGEKFLEVAGMFPRITRSGLNPRIISLTEEEDRVVAEWEGRATLVNGSEYNNQYAMVFVVRDGKVRSFREYLCTRLVEEVLVPLLSAPGG